MARFWQKILIWVLIIGLFGPTATGVVDFGNVKKAYAASLGDELLNDKDKLALEGKINEPGDDGSASLQVVQGDNLENLHKLLSRNALNGTVTIGNQWKDIYTQSFIDSLNEFQQSYWMFVNQSQRLILTQTDLDAIKQDKVDRRIKKFLIYLVAPKYLEGAGHELISVSRIVASEGDVYNDREPSIATHAFPEYGYSQAADIAIVDNIRCTLIKRRFSGDSYIPQPPVPIKIGWQGNGFGSTYGSAKDELGMGKSINSLIMGTGTNGFMDMLEEIGITKDNLSGSEFKDGVNLSDAALYIGKSLFEQVLSSPSQSWNGTDLTSILKNLGRAIIADQLGIKRDALQGSNPDEIITNIGRYSIEASMNLTAGSLKGSTSDEILKNIGKRKLERELGLPAGTINEDKIHSQSDLYKTVGQGLIESTLMIKAGDLGPDNYDGFTKALGSERTKWLQDNPTQMDEKLELPPNTTKGFNSNHDVSGYKATIGKAVIDHKLGIYQNYLWGAGDSNSGSDVATDGNQANKKDEAFSAPEGTMDKFIKGDLSILSQVGAYELAKTLGTSDQERELLYHWVYQSYSTSDLALYIPLSDIDVGAAQLLYENSDFHLPDVTSDSFKDYQLNEQELLSKYKTLHTGDLDSIFIFNDPNRVFKKEGYQVLWDGLKNSDLGQQVKQQLTDAAAPYIEKINEINDDIKFYKTRLTDIQTRSDRIETNITGASVNEQSIKTSIVAIKSQFKYLSDHLAVNSIQSSFKNIQKQWLIINAEINKPELKDLKSKIIADINGIHKDIEEMISGKASPLGENSDVIVSDGNSANPKTICDNLGITVQATGLYSCKDLVNLVQHPDQLDEFALGIARRKVEIQLQMPFYALGYFLDSKEKSFDTFKSSIGQAALEQNLKLPIRSFQSKNGAASDAQGLYQNLITSLNSQDPSIGTEGAEARINNFFRLPGTCGQDSKACLGTLLENSNADKWTPYLENLSKFDNQFSVPGGTTLKFLSGSISLANYTGTIGEYYLTLEVANRVIGSNIRVLGQTLTAKDIYNILTGHSLDAFEKIGGIKLEKALHLPEGYGYKLIKANAEDRLSLIAEIGGFKLGGILGIDRSIPLTSGNILSNIGNTAIEDAIGLTPQTFKGSLEDIIKANNYLFVVSFGLPNIMEEKLNLDWNQLREDLVYKNYNSETYKSFINYTSKNNTEFVQAIKARIAPQVMSGAVVLPNPLYLSQEDLKANNFSPETREQTRRFQSRMAEIDIKLSLPLGETAKLLKGEISPDDYRNKASNRFFTNLAAINLDRWLGLEGKYHFTLGGDDGLIKIYQLMLDPETRTQGEAKLYDAFSAVFSVDLDKKAGFTRGTIKSIILNPGEAHAILFTQGLIKIEDALGLGPADKSSKWNSLCLNAFLEKAYNAYQVAYDENGDKGEATKSATRSIVASFEQAGGMYLQQQIRTNTDNSIVVPLSDVFKIAHGDLTLLAIIKLADYALNINYIKDENGHKVLIPEKYRLTYQDVVNAVRGNPDQEDQIRIHAQSAASLEYEGINPRPINYDTSFAQLTPSGDSIMDFNYLGQSQQPPSENSPAVAPPVPDTIYNDSTGNVTNELGFDPGKSFNNMSLPTSMLVINSQTCTITSNLSPEQTAYEKGKCDYVKTQADNTVARQRRYWRTDPLYKLMDAQLYQANHNIPPGFARAMIEGSTMDRVYSLSGLLENVLRDSDKSGILTYLPQGTITTLIKYFSLPHGERAAQINLITPLMGGIDNYLRDKVFDGKFPPSGSQFTLALVTTATHNWKFSEKPMVGGQALPSLHDIMHDVAWSYISEKVDKIIGWGAGTAYKVYQMYNNLEKARKAYVAAKNAATALNTAAATKAASKANVAYNTIKAEIIIFIITTLFADELSKLDVQWGLPPGTMAGAVGVLVMAFIGVDPVTFAIAVVLFLANLIFGVRKIEYKCSACGYYPGIGGGMFSRATNTGRDPSCPLPEFDGMNEQSYRDGLVAAAKYKAKSIMQDALNVQEKTKDTEMRPTQVIIYNFQDVQDSAYAITQLYGTISQRGNSGVWANDKEIEYVHVGY